MSTKLYLYPICGKEVKSTSRLIRFFNVCKSRFYPKLLYKLPQHKSHDKKDTLGKNWEDKSDLFGKTVTTATVNGTLETLIEDTP